MKLYDGGAFILIILMGALIGWSIDADKLEKKNAETCSTVEIPQTRTIQ